MAKMQSSTPPFFNFLKEGFLLPARNRSLFVEVFAVVVTSTTWLLFLGKMLGVQPIPSLLSLDINQPALNGTDDPGSHDLQDFQEGWDDDTGRNIMRWFISASYHVFFDVSSSIIRIIVVFAAVATYSGELHTFGELLGKAKMRLKGLLLTCAVVYGMQIIAYVLLLMATEGIQAALMIAPLVFLPSNHPIAPILYVVYFVLFIAFVVLIVCLFFLGWLGVVVAVAEPGCHGTDAVQRAWHLMKGKKRRVLLFVAVTSALAAIVSPVHTLAVKTGDSGSGVLLELLYATLLAAVEVFTVCAMTAFYYECKVSIE